MKSKDIVRDLIEKITNDELKLDERIPSESQLAIKYNCNRHTVRKALESLIEKGFLRKTHKGPTYVNQIPSEHCLSLSSFYDLHKSKNINSKIITFKQITAPEEICKNLNIPSNSKVWKIIRVRYINNTPNHIEETYMPYSLFPNLTKENCYSSLLRFIEDSCDFEISHGIKTIHAIQLNENDAKLLNRPFNSLALQIENIGYLTNDRIYEYSINKHSENSITYYAKK